MKKEKHILSTFPEYYLVVLAILAGYTPPFSFNSIFIGITIILVLQIVFKNRISGIVIGIIFFLINLYMLGALISEFSEFAEFNIAAKQLLFGGLSLWILNTISSLAMINKYSKAEKLSNIVQRNIQLKNESYF